MTILPLTVLALALAQAAAGMETPPPAQRQEEATQATSPAPARGADIVVRGRPRRGAVVSDIPPERSLNNLDVRAYGATTVEELIQSLGTQVRSGRGRDDDRPVVLLNGKRVSSFAEIARLPTEAIDRMEVFPEDVALAYGYRADQKVVNVVTYERYSSRVVQASYLGPTDGGRDTPDGSADLLRIRDDMRLSIGVTFSRAGDLLESDRGIDQVAGVDPRSGRFRTLLPSSTRGTLDATLSGSVLPNIASTLNGRFEGVSEASLLGLGDGLPIESQVTRRVVHGGTTQAGRVGDWLWTITGNVDRSTTITTVDRRMAGRDDARLTDQRFDADLLLTGDLFDLPAGPVAASMRAGVVARDVESRSIISADTSEMAFSRDGGSIESSVDLPILAAGGAGRLSLNGNARLERVSGFGTLHGFGFGMRWSPARALDLRASFTTEQGIPTIEQQGGPAIVFPNARVFDVARGEAVDATRIFGGNLALNADDRRVLSAGATAKPFGREFTVTVDYIATRVEDPIAALPLLTSAVEAAFADRFTRDASGRLLRVDSRPLNLARSTQQQLRTGLNWSRPLGPVPAELRNVEIRFAPIEPESARSRPPGTTVQTFAANTPQARMYQNLSSRLFANVQHVWRLQDDVLLRGGSPTLDLLGGDAIDLRGGRPRHEVEMQVGAFKRGLGARATVNWRSGTSGRDLAPSAFDPEGRLDFEALTTANLFLFANVGDHLGGTRSPTWLRGTRVTLGVVNLFNARPQVRDRTGSTPLVYQPSYLDPLGRLVSLSLRKIF